MSLPTVEKLRRAQQEAQLVSSVRSIAFKLLAETELYAGRKQLADRLRGAAELMGEIADGLEGGGETSGG